MTPKQRRDAAMLKQQAIVSAAKAEGNRALTAEEQAEFEGLQREIEQADAETEAQERGLLGGAGAAQPLTGGQPPAVQPEAAPETQTGGTRGIGEAEAERARAAEIVTLCRDFDVDPTEHIQSGASLDQVRAAILEGLKRTGAPIRAQVTRDEGETFRQRASDALVMRAGLPEIGRAHV